MPMEEQMDIHRYHQVTLVKRTMGDPTAVEYDHGINPNAGTSSDKGHEYQEGTMEPTYVEFLDSGEIDENAQGIYDLPENDVDENNEPIYDIPGEYA